MVTGSLGAELSAVGAFWALVAGYGLSRALWLRRYDAERMTVGGLRKHASRDPIRRRKATLRKFLGTGGNDDDDST